MANAAAGAATSSRRPVQPAVLPREGAPRLLGIARIWDRAPHNAFTDLLRHRGRWYCVFREAENHVGSLGRIRLVTSIDGSRWESAALLAERGMDLRDPKLSVDGGGGLLLLAGGSRYRKGLFVGRQPRVARSVDGATWSPFQPVLDEGDWLWRLTWVKRRAYGVSYRLESAHRWSLTLVESGDGLAFREVARLAVPGKPNETTIRFLPGDEAVALVRREGGSRKGWIGRSRHPYERWSWVECGERLGGPNFVVLPGGRMWGASRIFRSGEARTALAAMSLHSFTPRLLLPSGGDCGYPGLALRGRTLWASYYSSHEGRTAIYLARIALAPATTAAGRA